MPCTRGQYHMTAELIAHASAIYLYLSEPVGERQLACKLLGTGWWYVRVPLGCDNTLGNRTGDPSAWSTTFGNSLNCHVVLTGVRDKVCVVWCGLLILWIKEGFWWLYMLFENNKGNFVCLLVFSLFFLDPIRCPRCYKMCQDFNSEEV